MKKEYFILVVVSIGGYIITQYIKPGQWNILVYSILFLLCLYGFLEKVLYLKKIKKGIFVSGTLKENTVLNSNEDVDNERIEFVSPIDGISYTISCSKEMMSYINLHSSKEAVQVWVNERNPNKSLVVTSETNAFKLSQFSLALFTLIFLVLLIWSL